MSSSKSRKEEQFHLHRIKRTSQCLTLEVWTWLFRVEGRWFASASRSEIQLEDRTHHRDTLLGTRRTSSELEFLARNRDWNSCDIFLGDIPNPQLEASSASISCDTNESSRELKDTCTQDSIVCRRSRFPQVWNNHRRGSFSVFEPKWSFYTSSTTSPLEHHQLESNSPISSQLEHPRHLICTPRADFLSSLFLALIPAAFLLVEISCWPFRIPVLKQALLLELIVSLENLRTSSVEEIQTRPILFRCQCCFHFSREFQTRLLLFHNFLLK